MIAIDKYIQVKAFVHNIADRKFIQGVDNFIVVRNHKGGLWYYGAYGSEERAKEVAKELENGLVLIAE